MPPARPKSQAITATPTVGPDSILKSSEFTVDKRNGKEISESTQTEKGHGEEEGRRVGKVNPRMLGTSHSSFLGTYVCTRTAKGEGRVGRRQLAPSLAICRCRELRPHGSAINCGMLGRPVNS